MNILAIETSCDETSLALVEARGGLRNPKFRVYKNLISSQIPVHRPFGGVVPNLAKREHIKNLPVLARQIFGKWPIANGKKNGRYKPHLIAVTVGPGLEPALWAGIEFAKKLHTELQAISHTPIALLGANHLEGHLYSFLFSSNLRHLTSNLFPAIALIVSGGHTILLALKNLTTWKKLGETRDDAAGEAFDKVARLLGLPYPGGPEIQKISRRGKPNIPFPRPMAHQKNYDFSFSGLKTSVLYYLRDNANVTNRKTNAAKKLMADVAASFQEAVIDVLAAKTMRAVKEFGAKSVLLSGGVAANKALRAALSREAKKSSARFLVPDYLFNTDNAAMIAVAAYINYLKGKKYKLVARGDMNI
ncbi:MAG: tRNA (adenosine(37)-N6)-threonylcarbamoyltransferase complex transferase subunit TsaD [Candidatus Liptonbacteria bacterium]|nr:tRNA (adenosine(37)-N6)-threonylcarbamoyltransferase complex transferase subunit TsaD [Candidatus Liptonbacteria bacterium]